MQMYENAWGSYKNSKNKFKKVYDKFSLNKNAPAIRPD